MKEWTVLKDDKTWSDRFNKEYECVEHIEVESKKVRYIKR